MEEEKYSDQLLTRYLCGDLSAQETERLDEMSFTDDELAARLQAVETDLVDAYVRGNLSGPTLEHFTSHYLSSPWRREKVAMARGFQHLLSGAAANAPVHERGPRAEPGAATGSPARRGFLQGLFLTPKPAFQWALTAAVILVLLAAGWLTVENLRLREDVRQSQTQREALQRRERELQADLAREQQSASEKERELADLREQMARLEEESARQNGESRVPELAVAPNTVSFTLTPQARGGGQPATLSIPADAGSVALRLELEPNDFTAFHAELKSLPGNAAVWKGGPLRARAKGDGKAIVVSLRPALLRAQRYVMEVYGVSPAGASELVGSYPFQVARP